MYEEISHLIRVRKNNKRYAGWMLYFDQSLKGFELKIFIYSLRYLEHIIFDFLPRSGL